MREWSEELVVDGIVSRRHYLDDLSMPMVQYFDAVPQFPPGEWFRARWDEPPTEDELKQWIAGEVDW